MLRTEKSALCPYHRLELAHQLSSYQKCPNLAKVLRKGVDEEHGDGRGSARSPALPEMLDSWDKS